MEMGGERRCRMTCKNGVPCEREKRHFLLHAHRMNAKAGELFHEWLAYGFFSGSDHPG